MLLLSGRKLTRASSDPHPTPVSRMCSSVALQVHVKLSWLNITFEEGG